MVQAFNQLTNLLSQRLGNGLSSVSHNRYTLTVDGLLSPISILNVEGEEQLNQPWHYLITFTSSDKALSIDAVLNQPASFTFNPANSNPLTAALSSLSAMTSQSQSRICYGVITAFNQLSVNKDEAHYSVVLSSRLALLSLNRNSTIFQNQSVVSVVEEVLRNHGFTGVDYRLMLKENYPAREFITQWQESDLEFIQRLLSDVGIWFRFESHAEHHCDVLVLSDYEQGYHNAGSIDYKMPTGTLDAGTESVWDMSLHSQTVESSIKVQDYNYRDAQTNLQGEVSTQKEATTTYGTDYRYGEHYKRQSGSNSDEISTSENASTTSINNDNNSANRKSDSVIETGQWYARIRHEHVISQQIIIKGKSNSYPLSPGQHIRIDDNPLPEMQEGFVILSVSGQGNRSDAYELSFTAIPYQVLKPYRPAPLPWPQVTGTLPARVTSPDNDTYGYIDILGRYRVKLNFDLKSWKNGEESLWLRLAKPYAGDTYGFHFPLIDGTEVAIAFTDGNPDRPYIAHAMHNSSHRDHVSAANKHRNVIRTPANNKLRMDDKRGQEHIKLATEYGKTQLNVGHLVNEIKEQRGEGFELRTDKWGAIAANKGLYLTAQTEAKAQGKQLDMQGAITQLENALSIAKALQKIAQTAQAHQADTDSQKQLQSALTQLAQAGIIAYSPDGIGLTSDENIQLSSGNSISIITENQTDVTALKNVTLSAGESVGILAQKSGMKLFANQGKVEIQSQNDAMELASKQDVKIDSVDGKITVTASQMINLMCGGSYIKINGEGIELGTSGNVLIKSNAMQKMGPANLDSSTNLPGEVNCQRTMNEQAQKQHAILALD